MRNAHTTSNGARGHNLCGVLVQTRAEHVNGLQTGLEGLPGVEVHRLDPRGQLVITVEDTQEQLAADTLSHLQRVTGMLSATLVYHHCDTDGSAAARPTTSHGDAQHGH